MKLPQELTTVTPLSKIVALIMFISLPIIGFFYGKNYQKNIELSQITPKNDSELFNLPRATPTPSFSDAWNIFQDKNLGISFEYPAQWKAPTVTQLSTHTTIEFLDGHETPDNTISPKLTINLGTVYDQSLQKEIPLAEYIEQITPHNHPLEEYERIDPYQSPATSPHLVGNLYTHTSRAGMGNWMTDLYAAQNMNSPAITELHFRYDTVRESDQKPPPIDPVLEHILSSLAISTYRSK